MSDKEKYEQAGRYLEENKSLDTELTQLGSKISDHATVLDQLSKFLHSSVRYDTSSHFTPLGEPDWSTLPTGDELRGLIEELKQKRARQAEVREYLRGVGSIDF